MRQSSTSPRPSQNRQSDLRLSDARLNEPRLEQDAFDPLVYALLGNFESEFSKYKNNDRKNNINQWLNKQGVNETMKYNITENEIVIAAKANSPREVNGPSVVRYKDGTCYVGNLTASQRNGFGYRTYRNSDLVYAGEYSQDKKQGLGRIYSLKRKVWGFKGQFANDLKNGHGRWEKADGNTYTGNFVNDKMHGYGVQTWIGGDRYDGNFEQDFKNGHGKLAWANGDSYDGNFVNNNMNGQGRYTWKNGEIFEGNFKDGAMWGMGCMDYTSNIGIKGTGREVQSVRQMNFDLADYNGPNRSQVH